MSWATPNTTQQKRVVLSMVDAKIHHCGWLMFSTKEDDNENRKKGKKVHCEACEYPCPYQDTYSHAFHSHQGS